MVQGKHSHYKMKNSSTSKMIKTRQDQNPAGQTPNPSVLFIHSRPHDENKELR